MGYWSKWIMCNVHHVYVIHCNDNGCQHDQANDLPQSVLDLTTVTTAFSRNHRRGQPDLQRRRQYQRVRSVHRRIDVRRRRGSIPTKGRRPGLRISHLHYPPTKQDCTAGNSHHGRPHGRIRVCIRGRIVLYR